LRATWLHSREDLEAWLARAGARVEVSWTAKAVEIEVALPVTVAPERAAVVDGLLAELNAELPDAGLRRRGAEVVAGHVAFLNHEGSVAAEVIERAIAACREAAARGAGRLGAPPS
jgi:hypothetical protein